ncbi:MAG TPA: YihY/virulence factor BrkB family protein [Acidimicrobiales bacterium]|nr:YihY/virulence factor BrkB family protein [Acidimicrobiales bacterium]
MTDRPVPPQTGEGGQADSPLELSPPDWKESLRRAVKEFKADRGSLTSAGMAFYWFLAIFPGLLAAVGIIGLLRLGAAAVEDVVKAIRETLPGDAAEVLAEAVQRAGAQSSGSSVAATVIGVALALWSASAGMVAMQTGLGVAYDVEEERKFVAKRATALLLLLVIVLLGGLASVLIVFGQPLGDSLRDVLPLGGEVFAIVWTIGRWLLAVLALITMFAAFYYIAPNRSSPKWTWVSPGGVLGVVIWLGASLAFSFYVSSFGSYAETYGSITGVVVLILWLYLTALAVVIGGELNAELERQSELSDGGRAAPGPRPAPPAEGPKPEDGDRGRSPEDEWAQRMAAVRQSRQDR